MGKMKKFLSLMLAVVMLFSVVPFATAQSTETTEYQVGDIIQFGLYPQTEITDTALIYKLNDLAPEWEDWTSYGYYSGTGNYGTMRRGDWMRYTDISFNDSKYRAVKFTQYRSELTTFPSSYTYQDDNGYNTDTVYWFKFEPIDWRILDPNTGLVMCETIIDSQPYSNTCYYYSSDPFGEYSYFNDSSCTNYANDYETSSIRQWLNHDFYNTAFFDSEKNEINATTLNNDGYYTSIGTTGYEALDSNETSDKIFLLSYNEVRNNNYGFSSNISGYDPARKAQGSDYAKSQGLWVNRNADNVYKNYYGNSRWLLRSPGNMSNVCCNVLCYGYASEYSSLLNSGYGVRPALRINLTSDVIQSEHQHSYESEITTQPTHLTDGLETFTCACGNTYTEVVAKLEAHTYKKVITTPTCTEQGYATYTCECGDTYTETIDATGHKDENGDYKCDNGCGYEYEKSAEPEVPSDPSENCSCNCHAGGIKAFFFKIINFFQKLFGMNKICECGAKH